MRLPKGVSMLRTAIGSVLVFFLIATTAHAERRVALVIGNSDYVAAGPLLNPANDARDVKNALERLGFDVTLELNLTSSNFAKTVGAFDRTRARDADLALLFYAGHGVQFEGVSYLVPVDASLQSKYAVARELYSLPELIETLEGARVSVVMLDACRNNLLIASKTRGPTTRGLAPIEKVEGKKLVVYATKENEVADDGKDRNSPFTKALLHHIETPGLEISTLLKHVRLDVMKATGDTQKPTWTPDFDAVITLKAMQSQTLDARQVDNAKADAEKRMQEQIGLAVQKALDERRSTDEARVQAEIVRRAADLEKSLGEKSRELEDRLKSLSAKESQVRQRAEEFESEKRRKESEINRLMEQSRKLADDQKRTADSEIERKRRELAAQEARHNEERLADEARRKEDDARIAGIKAELRRQKEELDDAVERNAKAVSSVSTEGYKPNFEPQPQSATLEALPQEKEEIKEIKKTARIAEEDAHQDAVREKKRRREHVRRSEQSERPARARRQRHGDGEGGGGGGSAGAPPP